MAIRIGTSGNDTLFGTLDDDQFFGLAGDDTMFGGAGNDTFFASAGSDTMNGGSGIDTVDYSGISSQLNVNGFNLGVYVSLQDSVGTELGGNSSDHYSSIENVTGSNFTDFIQGDANANVIRGLDGDDVIEGMGGADTLLGGGGGNDILSYSQSNARVVVDLLGNTANGGHATGDLISGFESLVGSAFSDALSGNNARNEINGGDGNDIINARGGNDEIEGGRGNDTMTGGTGFDTFVFSDREFTGRDHITDFDVTRDTLRFETEGDDGSFTIQASNFNLSTLTYDLTVRLTDSFGEVGTVVLEDIALADLNQVAGQIEIV